MSALPSRLLTRTKRQWRDQRPGHRSVVSRRMVGTPPEVRLRTTPSALRLPPTTMAGTISLCWCGYAFATTVVVPPEWMLTRGREQRPPEAVARRGPRREACAYCTLSPRGDPRAQTGMGGDPHRDSRDVDQLCRSA